MQDLSNRNKPSGTSLSSGENENFKIISGWVEPERNLIKNILNSKINLIDIFNKYKIPIEESFSPSGWSKHISCPFKEHQDKTPSFGFNNQLNIFNCFGCQKNGGPVQFISYLTGEPVDQICERLKSSYLLEEDFAEIVCFSEQIKQELFSFVSKINDWIALQNSDVEEYLNVILWPLDAYLRNHLSDNSINLDQLRARIKICLSNLNNYGD